ncbi:glutaredoxin-like protein NrdH [Globicatella sanguinis]
MEQTIKVYSKPNCMQCEMTKKFLKDNKINAIIYDVTKDEQALAEMKALGYTNLPVVYVDENTHWFGFRPDELEKLVP